MGLRERSRSVLHTKLTEAVGDEEAVGDMLSQFPASDGERPATQDLVRAEVHAVRAEVAGIRVELADFRTDMVERMGALKVEMTDLVHAEMRGAFRWLTSMFVISQALLVTAIAVFA